MRAVLSLTVLCMALAAPAVAQTPAGNRLVLADATRPAARSTVIDGANWRCEGTVCTASRGTDQPAPRACRRVVARLGAVTEFAWRGTALTPEQIAACNG